MVRHEAAEALGSIATDDILPALRTYAVKGPRVVRESCEVALDMYEVRLLPSHYIIEIEVLSDGGDLAIVRDFWPTGLCRINIEDAGSTGISSFDSYRIRISLIQSQILHVFCIA